MGAERLAWYHSENMCFTNLQKWETRGYIQHKARIYVSFLRAGNTPDLCVGNQEEEIGLCSCLQRRLFCIGSKSSKIDSLCSCTFPYCPQFPGSLLIPSSNPYYTFSGLNYGCQYTFLPYTHLPFLNLPLFLNYSLSQDKKGAISLGPAHFRLSHTVVSIYPPLSIKKLFSSMLSLDNSCMFKLSHIFNAKK